MIVVVIVTYNGMQWIERCLSSLHNTEPVPVSVIIIDNGSTDGTIEYIQENFSQYELIIADENLGFGRANNIGMRKALSLSADYIFLLNQDAWINLDTFPELIKCTEAYPEFGIISPLQLNADGRYDSQFLHYYTPIDQTTNEHLDQVKFVNASGWFMTAACVRRVGGFSPLFFHYGEDVDYCNRVRFHGFKVGVAKNCNYIHDRGVRKNTGISKEKQTNQVFIANMIRLANINRSLFLGFLINIIRLVQSILYVGANNPSLSKAAAWNGYMRSLKHFSSVSIYRKTYKSKTPFLD